ncbi:MAG TPA: C25 family peptidase propeptide domain-containing protein, partial [Anaerolineae bacterium]|nr:C25 family peptidase propeptide domain-containing protein [Anaerolineae bacterium]
MDRLSRSGLVLIMLLGLLLPAGVSGQETPAQEGALRLVETQVDRLIFEINVPLPAIEEVQVGGQVFQRLSLPGYGAAGAAGQPELPQTAVTLGIPTEGEVELRILDAKIEDLPGTYTVYPSPEHVVLRDLDSGAADPLAGVQEQFTWDAAAYLIDQFQPAAVVSVDETAFVRGQRIARVLIQPVQVNPAQGALRVYRTLRVEAIFSGAQAAVAHASVAPDLFDPTLQDQLLNFDQARAWRSERGQPLSSGHAPDSVYPGDTSRTWFKTHLRHSGLYKVTLADLQGAELAPLAAANPAYLQVWTLGQQVDAHFVGDNDTQFEAGEALLFYARIEPTIYSETDVYWLSVGDTLGLRMTTSDAAPAGAATDTTAWTTARFEEDYIFRNDLPPYPVNPPYPRWYRAELNNLLVPTHTVVAALPTAVTSGYTARLRIRMQGGINNLSVSPDHRVRVELNGQTVGSVTWDGLAAVQQEFQVPAAWLRTGINTILVVVEALPNVVIDRSFLDWIEIDYRQSFLALSDQAAFAAEGGGRREFQVEGFSGQDVAGFDVTDPVAPVRLTGLQATPMAVQPDNGEATTTVVVT